MSSVEQVVQDENSIKYYWTALAFLLYYDYSLTFSDEVQYVWKGRKSWVFVIFILNRYIPMAFMIWYIVQISSWNSPHNTCSKTNVLENLLCTWCTVIAQVVLNSRIHALAMKKWIITGFFSCITLAQFALGICMMVLVSSGASPIGDQTSINDTVHQICTGNRKIQIAYTAMSLFYDALAFLVVIGFVRSGPLKGFKMPRLLRTFVQDSTVYFLIIFTSHFVLEMSLLFARPTLQLLPSLGTFVYLPTMVSRLMLSLRKAADTSESEAAWSLTSVSRTSSSGRRRWTTRRSDEMVFAPILNEGAIMPTEGDIPLVAA